MHPIFDPDEMRRASYRVRVEPRPRRLSLAKVLRWLHCLNRNLRFRNGHMAVDVISKGKTKHYCTCGHLFGDS